MNALPSWWVPLFTAAAAMSIVAAAEPSTATVATGDAFAASASSAAVAQELARLRAEPAPSDELFALMTVTDRQTGERRLLTRGTPRAEYTQYVRFPETAPAGEVYSEGEEVIAAVGVETVIRSITRRTIKPGRSILSRDDQEELRLRQRNGGSALSERIDGGLRHAIESGSIDLAGTDPISVRIRPRGVPRLALPKVHDDTDAGLLWVGLEIRAARERALLERKHQLARLQQPLIAAIERAGGRILHALWLSGSIEAAIPARALIGLAAHRDVLSIDRIAEQKEVVHKFQGDDYYVAMDAEDFDDAHKGQHGMRSKNGFTSRVVLALEESCLDSQHPAWLNNSPDSWSRLTTHDCDPVFCDGCCDEPGGIEHCEGSDDHGTHVAQLMAADFMQGQEPGLDDDSRRKLTGTCPECRLIFYQDEGLNQRTAGLEEACRDGVDIFESSIGSLDTSCDGNGDYDAELEALIDCDAAYFQAAGNEGGSLNGACTTNYPADHPWTFTVGGIQSIEPCNTAGAYYTADCPYDPEASVGGGGPSGAATMIDIAAPFRFSNLIKPNVSPVDWRGGNGTSFSTPVVAGLAARLLDWWKQHISDSLFFDNRLRTVMLLFGDRTVGDAGPTRTLRGFSSAWGSGRVGLVPFDDLPEWAVSRRTFTIGADDSVTYRVNIPDGVPFFKAVVWHNGTDYTNEPQIGLTLTPVGCNTPLNAYITSDNKAMLVFPLEEPLGPSCTHVDITIDNIKHGSSGTRRFYVAAYAAREDEAHF